MEAQSQAAQTKTERVVIFSGDSEPPRERGQPVHGPDWPATRPPSASVAVRLKRPRKELEEDPAAAPPLVDPVEEASMDSFPCSDPPGYGHA